MRKSNHFPPDRLISDDSLEMAEQVTEFVETVASRATGNDTEE